MPPLNLCGYLFVIHTVFLFLFSTSSKLDTIYNVNMISSFFKEEKEYYMPLANTTAGEGHKGTQTHVSKVPVIHSFKLVRKEILWILT